PRIVGDVYVNRAAERAHAHLTIAAENDRPDVARRYAVRLDELYHALYKLLTRERKFHPVDFRGVDQPLHVLVSSENCRATGLLVATDSLKHRGAVVHNVGHYMDLRVLPANELPVVPNVVSLL